MAKLTLRLIIALLTFLLGIAAPTAWDIKRSATNEEARLIIPHAEWEPSFFRALDEHTKKVNLPGSRAVALPQNDLEVRLWDDAFPDDIDGLILRRSDRLNRTRNNVIS